MSKIDHTRAHHTPQSAAKLAAVFEHPSVQRARLRAKCERAVDRLIAILDAIEGDADDEPSLGFSEARRNAYALGALDQSHIAEGATDGREDEHDGREPTEDDEETLGRSENIDQSRREFSRADLEPWLGAPNMAASQDQRMWGARYEGYAYGGEADCEDEGAQCDDEGAEDDREPDEGGGLELGCHWQDEGDQTTLVPHDVTTIRVPSVRLHTNVGAFFPVGRAEDR